MQLTAEQKLKILASVTPAEARALETLWGIGEPFYSHLFQLFKFSKERAMDVEYLRLRTAFPDEEAAFIAWLGGPLKHKIRAILEGRCNGKS